MPDNSEDNFVFSLVPISEVAAPYPGAIKIGPFGSQLKKGDLSREGYKVYGQENIIAGDFSIGSRRVTSTKFHSLSSCRLFPNDLVITMMGTIGKCAIFPEDAEVGIMDSHLLRIQVNQEIADVQFVAMVTASEEIVGRQIERLSHGSIMSGLSSAIVRRLHIPLPSISEQRRIATILDTIDSQIQQTEQLIAKLKHQREGLLHDLLTCGLDEDGALRDPDVHPELFKDSVLGRIPREWEIKHLKDLTTHPITDFGSFSMTNLLDFRDSGVPFLKTESIHDNGIDQRQLTFISEEVHKQLPQSVVHEGDVLLTKIGAIGRVCVYDGSLGECNSNAASAKIRLDTNKVNTHFVAHYLRSNAVKHQYLKEIISTPPRINLGQINEWYIPIPLLREQVSIVAVLETLRADTSSEQSDLAKLKQYKQGLMHDLLTGNVRVGVGEDQA